MLSTETYFPRGTVKTDSVNHKLNIKKTKKDKPLVLFKKKQSKKKHEPRQQRREKRELKKNTSVRLNSVSLLLYETLQKGFVVVGCIKEIFSTQMTLTLPGRLVAQVKINKISDPFNRLLSSCAEGDVLPEDFPTLKDLFKVGELVTCCVEDVSTTEKGSHRVLLSLNPADINRDKTERILEENVVLLGAVKTKEDHGYAIDLGIEGVTAFLPFKRTTTFLKSQTYDSLPIGKVIRVAITKVLRARVGMTAVELTLEPNVVSKSVPRSGFTVDNLTPGQRMNVFIKQILPNGFEVSPVHAYEEYNSYVHISYVSDVWGNTSGLVPGKVFSATLLYTLTPVNILYFSLKNYTNEVKCTPYFQDGTVVDDAKVIATAKNCIFLQLGSKDLNSKGFVTAKQFGDETNFSIGQTLKTRILHYDFIEKVYICSLNRDIISAEVFSPKELHLGQIVKCKVIGFCPRKGLNLKLGTINAFAPVRHLTDNPHAIGSNVGSLFKVNRVVTAKVLHITEGNEVLLTLKPTLLSNESLCRLEDAEFQKYYNGTVHKIIDSGIIVRFFGDVFGLLPDRHIASHVTGLSKQSFREGQSIRCCVVFVDASERKLILSFNSKPNSNVEPANNLCMEVNKSMVESKEKGKLDKKSSKIENSVENDANKKNRKKKLSETENGVNDGDHLSHSVDNISVNTPKKRKKKLSETENEVIDHLSNSADNSIVDTQKKKKKKLTETENGVNDGDHLSHSVDNISVDTPKKRKKKLSEAESDIIDYSADNSIVDSQKKRKKKLSETENVASDGLFHSAHNSLLEKQKKRKKKLSETENVAIVDNHVNNSVDNNFVDTQKNKNKKLSGTENKLITSNGMSVNDSFIRTPPANEGSCKKQKNKVIETSLTSNSFKVTSHNINEPEKKAENKNKESKTCNYPRLSLPDSNQFFWNVKAEDFSLGTNEKSSNEDKNYSDDDDDDDDNDKEKHNKPKTPAEKKAAAKEAEKRLRQAEQNILDAEKNPHTVDHFERLVLAQPNNSLIWVKYMAYHLQATEIEKSRAVGKRALKIISYREEQERLNVWVALLNLENLYGTQESLKNTLDEAVRTNDEYKVYSKMAEIYADSKKNLELDQLTFLMVKKFKSNLECWLLCCRCLLKSGLTEKARTIFQRGLQNLLKKEHVQYITRFALMENSMGSPEHAQTLMENVLATYPGRISSWITYIDMLIKSGHTDLARNVLERSVGQKLPVKKMKTLYKKWLQFEEQYGSEASVNRVQEAAKNYVNSLNILSSNNQ